MITKLVSCSQGYSWASSSSARGSPVRPHPPARRRSGSRTRRSASRASMSGAAASPPETWRSSDSSCSTASSIELVERSSFARSSTAARAVPGHVLPAEREARRGRLAVLPAVLRPRSPRWHRPLQQRARLGHGHPHGQALCPRPRCLQTRGLGAGAAEAGGPTSINFDDLAACVAAIVADPYKRETSDVAAIEERDTAVTCAAPRASNQQSSGVRLSCESPGPSLRTLWCCPRRRLRHAWAAGQETVCADLHLGATDRRTPRGSFASAARSTAHASALRPDPPAQPRPGVEHTLGCVRSISPATPAA